MPSTSPPVSLGRFIAAHESEIIRRCLAKIKKPESRKDEVDFWIPAFLGQLVDELEQNGSKAREIRTAATAQGRDLFQKGFTASEVVHTYGSVCQSVTDLAVELSANVDATDFRTLNRCLDDAIAGAVSEYAHQTKLDRDDSAETSRRYVQTRAELALTALDTIQAGTVGVGGATGLVLRRCLTELLDFSKSRP